MRLEKVTKISYGRKTKIVNFFRKNVFVKVFSEKNWKFLVFRPYFFQWPPRALYSYAFFDLFYLEKIVFRQSYQVKKPILPKNVNFPEKIKIFGLMTMTPFSDLLEFQTLFLSIFKIWFTRNKLFEVFSASGNPISPKMSIFPRISGFSTITFLCSTYHRLFFSQF